MKVGGLIKRTFSSLLIFLIIFSSLTPAFAGDDLKGHWAENEMRDWMTKGLVSGYANGSIKPDGAITRAEFITLVNRAFSYTEKSNEGFKDVSAKDWFSEETLKAKAAGYISGYPDGTIRPNNLISRQEVASILVKLNGLEVSPNEISKFKDATQFPEWSKGIVGGVVAKGYLKGYADGTFKPTQNITRAEAVVTLNRVLNEKASITFNKPGIYGPESKTETIKENVIISAANVTLRNTVIEGDLTIAESVGEGDVFLKGVTVKGKTIVKGGGENSIHFEDSVLLTVIVNKENGSIRLVATGTTTVEQVNLQSGAKIEQGNTTGTAFKAVSIAENLPENSNVTLLGDFETVDVKATTIKIDIPKGSIKDLKVDANAKDTSINLSKDAKVISLILDAAVKVLGQGKVEKAAVNVNGTSFEQKPDAVSLSQGVSTTAAGQTVNQSTTTQATTPSTGGGGGGGGGGDTTAPTFNATDVYVTDDNIFIVIPFSENIVANVSSLKDNIKIATDGTNFVDLHADDKVYIGTSDDHKRRLIIQLNTPLSGDKTKIKVLANTVKDAAGNVQASEKITNAIVAHQTTPTTTNTKASGFIYVTNVPAPNEVLSPGTIFSSQNLTTTIDVDTASTMTLTIDGVDIEVDISDGTYADKNAATHEEIKNAINDDIVQKGIVNIDANIIYIDSATFGEGSSVTVKDEGTLAAALKIDGASNPTTKSGADGESVSVDGKKFIFKYLDVPLNNTNNRYVVKLEFGTETTSSLTEKLRNAIASNVANVDVIVNSNNNSTITITAKTEGTTGNSITLSKTGFMNFFVSGDTLTGGFENILSTTVTSSFTNGQEIAPKYSKDDGNTSLPVSWTTVNGAQSYALFMYDPDAGNFAHWVVKNVPQGTTSIAEGASQKVDFPGIEFRNDFGEFGYGGPQPPSKHTYKIVVYALNVSSIDLDHNIPPTLAQFEAELSGKVIGRGEISGTFTPADTTPPSIQSVTPYDLNGSGNWDPYNLGAKDKFVIVFSENLATSSKNAVLAEFTREQNEADKGLAPPKFWVGYNPTINWIDDKTLEIVLGENAALFPGEKFYLSKEAIFDNNNNKPNDSLSVLLPPL